MARRSPSALVALYQPSPFFNFTGLLELWALKHRGGCTEEGDAFLAREGAMEATDRAEGMLCQITAVISCGVCGVPFGWVHLE